MTEWTPRLSPEGWAAISNPRSIALVGASGRASSVSFTSRFLQTNADLGYAGEIFLINPNRTEIFGHRCWPDLDELPAAPDIVAINLPDEKVLPAVQAAIARGAKALMVHAGGFLERGAAGADRQAELQAICAQAGIPALGPNCLGFLSFTNRVSISSMKVAAGTPTGSIAAISQSGSVASLLQGIAGRHGLSFLASTGNEAVTGTEDLIAYAIDDPATRLIVAFIEALRDPPSLFPLAERAHAAGKPIIVVKAGLTAQGGEVSRGHTGAMAGSGEVYRQAFRQAGVILCDDFNELAQTVELAASWTQRPRSFRLGMLGTSGGELGAITDQCVTLGVTLAPLALDTLSALQTALHLPADVYPRNPVDVGTGFNYPGTYLNRMRGAIRAVAADPSVDIIAISQGFHRDSPDLAFSLNREIMGAAVREAPEIGKPVLVMSARAGRSDDGVMAEIRGSGLPALEGSREALRAIKLIADYTARLAQPRAVRHDVGAAPPLAGDAVSQAELFPLLASHGMTVTPTQFVADADAAARAVAALGGPAVMKIDTSRVIHKSDVGGVALGVTPANAREIFSRLKECLDPPVGTLAGEGIVIAPQVVGGVEFYVGAKRDASFGTVVVCGLGGRMLELLGRTALLVTPFGAEDALDAIARSGAREFLDGFRGGPRADFAALADLIVRVGRFAASLADRLDVLDLNPVIVTEDHRGGIVADARLLLRGSA